MNNNSPLISIIVPVYNTEKYLDQCIQSVLAQTYTNWELLLIDDGSTDSSGAICDRYAAEDSRIRVFHKENGGVSSARNLGLDNAKGEWITFVDSDDWLDEIAISVAGIDQATNIDIIVSSYMEYEGEEGNRIIQLNDACYNQKVETQKIIEQYLHTALLKCVWGQIYRRSCIIDIRFDTNIRYGEDTLFFLHVAKRLKSIKLCSFPIYFYRKLPNEGKYKRSIEDSLYAMMKLFEGYDSIRISNSQFEKDVYCDCKSQCQECVNITPRLWYHNIQIQRYYGRIKKIVTFEYRLRHFVRYFLAYLK